MHEELIAHFKTERKKLGLSQQDAADNSNVSMFTVNRAEKGESIPRLDKFMEMVSGIGFMVTIVPIPKSLKTKFIRPKYMDKVIDKPNPVDYDNWDETKPED